nr:hypothetical protein [Limimaricola litoreus]
MTELSGYDLQRHAVADEVAGIGVPQTMKDEGGGQAGSGGSESKWSSVLAPPDLPGLRKQNMIPGGPSHAALLKEGPAFVWQESETGRTSLEGRNAQAVDLVGDVFHRHQTARADPTTAD